MTNRNKTLGKKYGLPLLALLLSGGAVAADAPLTPAHLQTRDAQRLVQQAAATAARLGASVCIAVTDEGGTLVAFQRMEGAAPGCADSAIAKAHASAIFRTTTETFMNMVNKGQPAVGYLPGMVPLGGGVPIVKGGSAYGAVGVAGASIANEIKIATQTAAQL